MRLVRSASAGLDDRAGDAARDRREDAGVCARFAIDLEQPSGAADARPRAFARSAVGHSATRIARSVDATVTASALVPAARGGRSAHCALELAGLAPHGHFAEAAAFSAHAVACDDLVSLSRKADAGGPVRIDVEPRVAVVAPAGEGACAEDAVHSNEAVDTATEQRPA